MSVLSARQLDVVIGGKRVVRALDIDVAAGQCWAMLGLNGIGKTTLLCTLAGLRAPQAGNIDLRGRPLAAWPARELARERGVMPQDSLDPFPLTALEAALAGRYPHANGLGWDTPADIELATAALTEVGLAGFCERDCTSLSGGERRRVALATLLTQAPSLYFLDEPTNHLDPHHQVMLLDRLALRTVAGATIVMALHDPNLAARYCSHVLLLMGDGAWRAGAAEQVLTAASLSGLYGHPMREHTLGGRRVFVAD